MSDRLAPSAPALDVNSLPEIEASSRLVYEANLGLIPVGTWLIVDYEECDTCKIPIAATWMKLFRGEMDGITFVELVVVVSCDKCKLLARTQIRKDKHTPLPPPKPPKTE